MNNFSKIVFVGFVACFAGCATIVSKNNWPFSVQTDPSGVKVSIVNRKGVEVFNGKTPTAMRLKSGSGFFTKESYTVTLSMNGYEPKTINVECKLNGWYLGNILFGGVIGLLIVDPATGAMYKLDSAGLSENMTRSSSASSALQILHRDNIPLNWERHLVKIDW